MRLKQPKPAAMTAADAEALAAEAMAFLASDPARLMRFLGDTGMDPQSLAHSLADMNSGILSAALEHIVCDESLLLVCASELRRKPDEIMRAHGLLQGPAAQLSI